MAKINLGRVCIAGFAAGVCSVLLQSLSKAVGVRYAQALERAVNPSHETQLIMVLAEVFVGGPVAVWLYAAIRPRFGAGPRTALIAALWLWLFSAPYVQVVLIGLGLVRLVSLTQLAALDAFSLIPITAATLVGAWLYKEDDSNLQSQQS